MAPGKTQSAGIIESHNMKRVIDIQWVSNPTRQRLTTIRKRALRSRTERSARSVCSEHQSRVIEPRNLNHCWGLPLCNMGGSIDLYIVRHISKGMPATCKLTRPGSESRAKMHEDILGTWEGLELLDDKETGNRVVPVYQANSTATARIPGRSGNKEGDALRYLSSSRRRELRNGLLGRLSAPILALEIRETHPEGSL